MGIELNQQEMRLKCPNCQKESEFIVMCPMEQKEQPKPRYKKGRSRLSPEKIELVRAVYQKYTAKERRIPSTVLRNLMRQTGRKYSTVYNYLDLVKKGLI